MKNYIKVKQIDDNIDFVNLAITLKNVDSKSREDMKVVCKKLGFSISLILIILLFSINHTPHNTAKKWHCAFYKSTRFRQDN